MESGTVLAVKLDSGATAMMERDKEVIRLSNFESTDEPRQSHLLCWLEMVDGGPESSALRLVWQQRWDYPRRLAAHNHISMSVHLGPWTLEVNSSHTPRVTST